MSGHHHLHLDPDMKPVLRLLPLAWAAAATLAQAAPLVQTQSQTSQVLLPVSLLSVSDTSADGAAPVLSNNLNVSFGAFDASLGVLTGVQGSLTVDPGHGLMAYRTESGGQWESVARVRATWSLGSSVLSFNTLATSTSNKDTLVVTSTDWAGLGYTAGASALNGFVGTGTVDTVLNTAISAYINDGGGGSVAIAAVLDMNVNGGGPDADGLTGALSWQYQYLDHAQMSFGTDAPRSAAHLDLSSGSAAFSLHALGDASTTGADLVGWSCTGDCAAFQLDLAGFDGLQAGGSASGLVTLLGTGGNHAAQFVLNLRDDDAVGALASQAGQQMTLDVSVTAVPEPETWALMLAGLGFVGLRRRTPR